MLNVGTFNILNQSLALNSVSLAFSKILWVFSHFSPCYVVPAMNPRSLPGLRSGSEVKYLPHRRR